MLRRERLGEVLVDLGAADEQRVGQPSVSRLAASALVLASASFSSSMMMIARSLGLGRQRMLEAKRADLLRQVVRMAARTTGP
jgi:hypothetical protein